MQEDTMTKIKSRFTFEILLAIGVVFLFKVFGFDSLSLEFISGHREELETLVQNNIYYSLFLYAIVYIVFLSIGAPIGAIMSVVAGYFFGIELGMFAVLPVAMISASITFFLGNKILNTYVRYRYKERIADIEDELDQYGFYYVLATRFSSVLPFFLVNLLFGASGLSWKNYLLPTFLGLIPGTIIYVNIGSSLKNIESFNGIFDLKLILMFLFLGILAFLPVVIKHLTRRQNNV
jgi:uncharacterized membrane protein YdjX (TVP38/TMEM64 family)